MPRGRAWCAYCRSDSHCVTCCPRYCAICRKLHSTFNCWRIDPCRAPPHLRSRVWDIHEDLVKQGALVRTHDASNPLVYRLADHAVEDAQRHAAWMRNAWQRDMHHPSRSPRRHRSRSRSRSPARGRGRSVPPRRDPSDDARRRVWDRDRDRGNSGAPTSGVARKRSRSPVRHRLSRSPLRSRSNDGPDPPAPPWEGGDEATEAIQLIHHIAAQAPMPPEDNAPAPASGPTRTGAGPGAAHVERPAPAPAPAPPLTTQGVFIMAPAHVQHYLTAHCSSQLIPATLYVAGSLVQVTVVVPSLPGYM